MPRVFLITNKRYPHYIKNTSLSINHQALQSISNLTTTRLQTLDSRETDKLNEEQDEAEDLSIRRRNDSNSVSSSNPSTPSPEISPSLNIELMGQYYSCLDCGKKYTTSSNLARHRQTHRSLTDKKARECPHCNKVYVSMPAYSMHIRTHKQGSRCSYCGKCFSRPWLLQGHIRTHTGEKPFSCPKCSKSFADKSNLRAHIQTHSTIKPFVCQRCGKAFTLKSYLYKHEDSSCMRINRQPVNFSNNRTLFSEKTV